MHRAAWAEEGETESEAAKVKPGEKPKEEGVFTRRRSSSVTCCGTDTRPNVTMKERVTGHFSQRDVSDGQRPEGVRGGEDMEATRECGRGRRRDKHGPRRRFVCFGLCSRGRGGHGRGPETALDCISQDSNPCSARP